MRHDDSMDALAEERAEERSAARLRALAEYAELRNRWILRLDQPGDRKRCQVCRAILEGTGGVPEALTWPRFR
jgi:hypothetical protein